MTENHEVLTATKGAVLILETAISTHDLPLPTTIHASRYGDLIFIMEEPAEVYLWAQALGGDVEVRQDDGSPVTFWNWRTEWFDQPLRVTTNRRESAEVSA